ncbi:MAG: alpha/beta fold hydrolase [Minisyncoccia bacterium]
MKYFKSCPLFLAGLFFLSFFLPFNSVFAQTNIYVDEIDDIYHISVDTTWTKEASPYVIYGNISLDVGATLTIEPGTIIKIKEGVFYVSGKLIANGSTSDKVYFTSIYDDSVGGDTDRDEELWNGVNIKWVGLFALEGANLEIHNAEILHSVYVLNSNFASSSFDSVTISDCYLGIELISSSLNIKNSNISNISQDAITLFSTSTVSIDSSSIKNIGRAGFTLFDFSSLTFSNSNLENVFGDAFFLYQGNSVEINNSTIKDIRGGGFELDDNNSLTLSNSNLENIDGRPFLVNRNNQINIDNSVIKKVGNGQYKAFDVYGNGLLNISNSKIENTGDLFSIIYDSHLNVSNTEIKNINGDSIIETFVNSSVEIKNSTIKNVPNGDWAAISGFDNSSINIASSSLESITADSVFQVFCSSSLSFSSSSLSNVSTGHYDGAFVIYGCNNEYATTTLNIANSVISDGNAIGLEIFGNTEANIKNTKIQNFLGDGVKLFSDPIVRILDSEISGNKNGIQSLGADVEIKNSIIADNKLFGIYNEPPYLGYNVWINKFPLKATQNWWGDKSGPLNIETNASGTANKVSSNVDFIPWLTSDPSIKKKTPVIIIPGIMGTQISKNYDSNGEVWPNIGELLESFGDSFLDDLSFMSDGMENPSFPMTIGDIMRKIDLAGVTVLNTFDGLISTLISSGYTEGTDLFVFPYDWRKSNADDAILLKNKIDTVLAETGMSKVDIIAHSMGGLVAQKYVADEGGDKIDKLIFIGTPHLGAPKAFKALMYGDDMGINKFNIGLNQAEIKTISQNFPSVFDLLPSRGYVDGNASSAVPMSDKYIYDMTASTSKWLNYDEIKNFIIGRGGNEALFPQAESLHTSIDNFDLSGVDVYNFSGCGTKTIGSITIKKKKAWTSLWQKIVDDPFVDYRNGDVTVPLSSATGPFGNHNFYIKSATHAELPSVSGVPETIFSILSGSSTPSVGSSNISRSIDSCYISGTVPSSHSPVSMNIYDDLGNHTGPTDTGDIEYGIPGVNYDLIDGTSFAFLPQNGNYKIVLKATDTGAYDFYIDEVGADDTKTGTKYWNEIPLTTLSTNSEINISATSTDYIIRTDQDGDGFFESSSTPSAVLSSSTLGDLVPPQSMSIISNGTVSLSATDDNAGVLKTEYSFDANFWTLYTKPFSASGKTVSYFSTDNAGNIESIQSISVPALKVITPVAVTGGGGPIIQISTSSLSSSVFISLPHPFIHTPSPTPLPFTTPLSFPCTRESNTSACASSTQSISSATLPSTSSLSFLRRQESSSSSMDKVPFYNVTSTPKISTSTQKFHLTASIASFGVDIKSTIVNIFQKFWSHLSSLFKKKW